MLAFHPNMGKCCPMPDGVYDGSRCTPEKREAIVGHVLNGTPMRAIAEAVHASESTVAVIRDQEVPEWRKAQASNFKQYAHNVTRSLLAMTPEQLAKASLYERTISLGIVVDKILTLEGEPTSIIEHRHSVNVSSLKDSLCTAPAIDAEIVSSEPTP